jgi:choline-sulfatase
MPPNLLVIMSDQHDPGISTPYGHPFIRTPHQQRLADEGAVFENAYCNSPLCVPSRASFMTGRHLHHTGVWDNQVPLATDAPTWAHRLNSAGYETCLDGKMHFVGPDQLHGFTRRIMPDIHGRGGNWKMMANWTSDVESPLKGDSALPSAAIEAHAGEHPHMHYDEEVARKAETYLSEPARHEQPWALCASLFTPHFPFVVREPYFSNYYPEHTQLPDLPDGDIEGLHPQNRRFRDFWLRGDLPEDEILRSRGAYYGLVEFCDHQIGRILDALEQHGLADNTIVAYVSDHGEMLGEHGLWFKRSFYEQSSRVPLMVRWPGVVEVGSRYERATSLIDLVATMLDVADADREHTDGESLAPLLRGKEEDGEGLAIVEFEGAGTVTPARMIRRGRYKLNYYHGEPTELFDLEADPGEYSDLAEDEVHAGVVAELTQIALTDWDPARITERVLESQQQRRIVAEAMGGPWSPTWRNGKY